jgi:tetratricopeptide (TPR) repeat protein
LSEEQVNQLLDRLKTLLSVPPWLQEQYNAVVWKSSLTDAALATFFRSQGEDQVAPEELDAKLRQYVAKWHTLEQQVMDLPEGSPFKSEANAALQAGAYDRAAVLLAIAIDQIRAVKLIDDGQSDQALTLLDDVERRLDDISENATSQDVIQRAYNYKTYAEALVDKGKKAAADPYLDRAYGLFVRVRDNPTTPRDVFAGAINGIGNVHQLRGKYQKAIADYQLATNILPNYAYAWDDMFLTYIEMAKLGNVDLAGMRRALDETKANALGVPGLDSDYLARLEALWNQYAPAARQAHKKSPPGADSTPASVCDPDDFTPDRNGNLAWDGNPCINSENYLTFRGGRTPEENKLAADIMSLDHRAHDELGPGTPQWKEVLGMLANAAIGLKEGDTNAGRLLYSKADQAFSAHVKAKKSR